MDVNTTERAIQYSCPIDEAVPLVCVGYKDRPRWTADRLLAFRLNRPTTWLRQMLTALDRETR